MRRAAEGLHVGHNGVHIIHILLKDFFFFSFYNLKVFGYIIIVIVSLKGCLFGDVEKYYYTLYIAVDLNVGFFFLLLLELCHLISDFMVL